MIVKGYLPAFLGTTLTSILLAGSVFVSNGCTTGEFTYYCKDNIPPDADPNHECTDPPDGGVEGGSLSPQSLDCIENGGECVELGTGKFKDKAVLLWIGDELTAPECPERAPLEDFTGHGDPVVDVQCDQCNCGAPTCILPHAIGVDTQALCMSGISDNYAAPNDWDGSCYSPAKLAAGSFSSFALPAATVSACTPSTNKPIGAPGAMAPRSNAVFGGVGFKTNAKACKGDGFGACAKHGQTCVQNAEPPPPHFQYCVMYLGNVDEAKLPECPAAFPEPHLFYDRMEGKRECSACQCSEPMDGQCVARFSAFQDPACANNPLPFFENVSGPQCLVAMQAQLGAISATWWINAPGKCDPSGGEPVGEAKPVDPSVFCCKPLPPADVGSDASKE